MKQVLPSLSSFSLTSDLDNLCFGCFNEQVYLINPK